MRLTEWSLVVAAAGRRAVTGPAVWCAADMADATRWTIELGDVAREAIIAAAERAARDSVTLATLRADAFALPELTDTLDECADELQFGRAFVLLRGFPTDRLSPTAVELAYAGLGLHFGTPVSQDTAGTLLGHVRDERISRTGPGVRLYRTRERQDFHTDGADIIGLLCLHGARSGGQSRIVSSYAVYNEMLARRPDLVEVLYEPLYWDRNDEQPKGDAPFYPLSVFTDIDGVPRVFYIGWYIRDAQRHDDAPRLTAIQLEAMELLESIANDPAFYVEMDFRPGDIQLLNNARILHSREAYEDDDDPAERRHLLRLWLAARRFASVEAGLRGGIPVRR